MNRNISFLMGKWCVSWEEPDGIVRSKLFDNKDDLEEFLDFLDVMEASNK